MSSAMINIGFDAKRMFYNRRGLGNYSRETVRILSEQQPDNKYYLFSPGKKGALPITIPASCQLIQPAPFWRATMSSVWRSFTSINDIKKLNLDVYHGLSHELPVGIEHTSTRSVVTMHDLIFIKQPQLYPAFDRYMYREKYLGSCQRADAVIAISQETKRDLLELTTVDAAKIHVVYQGCHPVFSKPVSPEAKQAISEKYNLPVSFILTVGALEVRKNHALIIKALSRGKLDIPLVIAGKQTPYMSTLKALVEKEQLSNRVLFLPDLPAEDLPALYHLATLFIYPSFYEGFGIPILEALSTGVPVITTRGGCFEEAGGPGTRYVDASDEEELIYVIKELLDDPTKRATMIETGFLHAKQFSDVSIAKNLMGIYRSLL